MAKGTNRKKRLHVWDYSAQKYILVNNQPDALFRVFIYSFHLSTCFEGHSAHHQEIELY